MTTIKQLPESVVEYQKAVLQLERDKSKAKVKFVSIMVLLAIVVFGMFAFVDYISAIPAQLLGG